jgi:hypothetical protein
MAKSNEHAAILRDAILWIAPQDEECMAIIASRRHARKRAQVRHSCGYLPPKILKM